jgi:hypothetical protein
MSLFENIIEALNEFKNDIISSLKNEIINLKQEIVNLNREKDEEINILKQELLRMRQELEQSEIQHIEHQKEILKLQQLCKKLKNQIPSNLQKIAEKNNYEELMSNCFGLYHLDKFDTRNNQQIDEIYKIVKDIIDDDDEYIIADKSFLDNYKYETLNWQGNPSLLNNLLSHVKNDKTDFIITNKGKVFIKYDKTDYSGMQYNLQYMNGYYYVDFNIKCVSYQFIHLIIMLIARVKTMIEFNSKHLNDPCQALLKYIMDFELCCKKNIN